MTIASQLLQVTVLPTDMLREVSDHIRDERIRPAMLMLLPTVRVKLEQVYLDLPEEISRNFPVAANVRGIKILPASWNHRPSANLLTVVTHRKQIILKAPLGGEIEDVCTPR
ncbi:uncharacterized protein DNG_09452 [Cephalotrichum gorgonifer]|uniref:Uncharacterized protein n=1 Tax=Cephalotrichum gorgonifer TaxID=2041049 RepID=A0AAE8N7T7_9PEZI|nr:uncharacterized protein DNG_09452 [Cephalotrichum gorgonifer]